VIDEPFVKEEALRGLRLIPRAAGAALAILLFVLLTAGFPTQAVATELPALIATNTTLIAEESPYESEGTVVIWDGVLAVHAGRGQGRKDRMSPGPQI
jgi:hypothetical protein